jgi:hypothetical protein
VFILFFFFIFFKKGVMDLFRRRESTIQYKKNFQKIDVLNELKNPEIEVSNIGICSTGNSFAAATIEGISIFSNTSNNFTPIDLDPSITPSSIKDDLKKGLFSKCLIVKIFFFFNFNFLIFFFKFRIQ